MLVSYTKAFEYFFFSLIFKLNDVNSLSVKHQFYLKGEGLQSPQGIISLKGPKSAKIPL